MMPLFGDLSGQQAGVITPNQIPNITLWYNSSNNQTLVNGVLTNNFQSNPLTDGTEVTKWKDLSGVGQDANVYNAGGGNGPLYKTGIQNSLSALFYASANKRNLDINPIGVWAKLQSGFTIYTLIKITSLPASVRQIVVTDANLGHQWTGSYWQVGAAGGLATAQSTTISTTSWTMHGMIFDGSYVNAGNQGDQNAGRLKYRYNKVGQTLTFSANPGTQTSNTASVMYIGGNNRNATLNYMDGYIGEVLIWTRALSITEQGQIETYLNDKWALGL